MDEKPQEFNDKQRHILETAERLFATKGFEGTSVRDIAHEAGINIAMISYYFGSKEKLLESLFLMRSELGFEKLGNMLQNAPISPLEKIYKLIDALLDRILNYQHFYKITMREEIAHKDSTVSEMLHARKKRNQQLVRSLIQEGQKAGVFKKNIDMPLMMVTLIGTVHQFISTQHHYREINRLQDMPDADFKKLVRKKLSVHLKTLFKAILTYDKKN